MISRKFAEQSNDRITNFMNAGNASLDSDDFLDSVENMSDLWVLANIKKSSEMMESE